VKIIRIQRNRMCSLKLGTLFETSLEKIMDATDAATKAITKTKKGGTLR
jgi:hypothetical protein